MKYIAAVVVALFVMSFVLPLYAGEQSTSDYATKIRACNKRVAAFVADTCKLPYVLMGDFTTQNHEKVVEDLKYEGHQELQNTQQYIIKK